VITVAILTVSDSAAAGTREDVSGPSLRKRCEELGWAVVASEIIPDERKAISERLREWADNGVAKVVLTTGGTGITHRDVTPEGTRAVLDREIPGFGELMRAEGLQQTPMTPLSRALAGSRGRTLIVNLPGSPKGALYSLGVVAALIPHAVQLLGGQTEH
jgi:molybdenum cofactor synthesis domain-containing protein